MSLVCVVGTFVSYLSAIILDAFQDFEFAAFRPFVIKIFKVFFDMPVFIVFGGLTLIDWTSKPLLQSLNFRSFFVVFGLTSV